MPSTYQPSIQEIRDTFADEIASLGGTVADVFDDGERLYVRSVLDADAEIRPGDVVRGGIAMRAVADEIIVYPYTFRVVCTNGAIFPHALESLRLERAQSTQVFLSTYESAVTLSHLRDIVRACGAPEVFGRVTNELLTAADMEADLALHLLPMISRMPPHMTSEVLPHIFGRFAADGDRSGFGLVNAVTSVARDTQDPETRWALEELGGMIPGRLMRERRTAPPSLAAAG